MLSLIYRSLETIETIIKDSLYKEYGIIIPPKDIIVTLQIYNRDAFLYITTNGSSDLESIISSFSNIDDCVNPDICVKVQTSQDFNADKYAPTEVSCFDDDMYYICIDCGSEYVKEVMKIKKILNSINKVPMIEV